MTNPAPKAPLRPLEGVVVLDFTRFLPGPFATQILGDLGASVIKVETPPGGDPVRSMTPSVGYPVVNRRKKSLCIDFRSAEGRDALRRLVAKSDVLVEVSRPDAMAALGLDYATVRHIRPDIIYCSISAYGQNGPYKDMPSHGMNLDSLAGMLTVREAADGSPYVPEEHPYLSSLLAAHSAAIGVCAALFRRKCSGQGERLDISCWDSALVGDPVISAGALNCAQMVEGFASRATPKYAPYKTKDGRYLMVCAIERKFWTRFCDLIERADLATAFDAPGRSAHDNAAIWGQDAPWVYDEVAGVIALRDLAAWEAVFEPSGLPVTAVKTRKEALESTHAAARELVVETATETDARLRLPRTTQGFAHDLTQNSAVSALGGDTDEVLAFAGYSDAEIQKMRAAKICF